MWVQSEHVRNTKFHQPLTVEVGDLYLLEYQVYMDTLDNPLTVTIDNPGKSFWPQLHASYLPVLTPPAQWVERRMLVRPQVTPAQLTVWTGLEGRAGLAAMRLRPVRWRLMAQLPQRVTTLHLYAVTRDGHRMTRPDSVRLDAGGGATRVMVASSVAQRFDVNPHGVLIQGDHARLWTLPTDYPLRSRSLRDAVPDTSAGQHPAALILPRGGATTLLLAVETRTPHAVFKSVACEGVDLPVRIERLAEIPVYDSYFPKGSTSV